MSQSACLQVSIFISVIKMCFFRETGSIPPVYRQFWGNLKIADRKCHGERSVAISKYYQAPFRLPNDFGMCTLLVLPAISGAHPPIDEMFKKSYHG